MSFFRPKSIKNQNKIPRPVKSLIRNQQKNARKVEGPENDHHLLRYNELGNRARRSFHHDGPGGNYDGY